MTTALHPATHPELSLSGLLPRLVRQRWTTNTGLSDDGFCDSVATLPLSQNWSMTLRCTTSDGGINVSQRGLDELGVSIQHAWDFAAINLAEASRSEYGTQFWMRPASAVLGPGCPDGVQVATSRYPISSWLAHPRAFLLLDDHLRTVLAAQRLVYLVPDPATVIALAGIGHQEATAWAQRAQETRPRHRVQLSSVPLLLVQGFPQDYCLNI